LFIFSTIAYGRTKRNGDDHKFIIVLDAGHGGKDSGNTGNGFSEKNIALQIVLQVGKELEKYPNIKVIYTRTKDVFVTLKGRAETANEAKADLFVSIHMNSYGKSSRPH